MLPLLFYLYRTVMVGNFGQRDWKLRTAGQWSGGAIPIDLLVLVRPLSCIDQIKRTDKLILT